MSVSVDTSRASPNHSDRRGAPISMLVVHATVGGLAGSLSWLCSKASKVSTHYLISKEGHIFQLVPDTRAAWHAGISAWKGMGSLAIKNHSIGVELENLTNAAGFKGQDPYPNAQIHALTALAQDLSARYHIQPGYIVRHLDIAIPKGRKSDPAGFPWDAWIAALYAPMARLWVVRAEIGANVRQRPTAASPKVPPAIPQGALFHGEPVEGAAVDGNATWIARLPSEGGGNVWSGAVQEVK